MRVIVEVLPPGMEHGEAADVRPKMRRVPGDVLEGLCHGTQEHAREDTGILEAQGPEGVWQRQHHMDVGDIKHLTFPRGEPGPWGGSVTLGAVAVATGVRADLLVATLVTQGCVAPQGGRRRWRAGPDAAPHTGERHSVPGRGRHTAGPHPPLRGVGGSARLLQRQRIEGARGRGEGLWGAMEVAPRTAQAAMAPHELNPPEIDACSQSVRGADMAQHMRVDGL
jgi:hypothetical protein